jgi:MFS family permease
MTLIFSRLFQNAWLLSISNAIAGSTLPLMHLAGTLAGSSLAPSPDWATAPIALMITGTACSVVLVSKTMQRLGRKMGLMVFLGLGIIVCLMTITALEIGSFTLFCLASFMLGAFNATLLQGRFAAMETVSSQHRATAASMYMGSGIIAAFVGPEIAVLGKDISNVPYQGSFMMAILCILIACAMLTAYKPSSLASIDITKPDDSPIDLFQNPSFCLALTSGAIAYVVMSFVMTATPISMHEIHQHSLVDTKWVIQSHIAAMFLPSFVSPLILRCTGIRGMMALGLLLYCVAIGIGYSSTSAQSFWIQLVLLGIGWNFLFIGSTTLLPTTHSEKQRYRAQSLNDFVVFSFQAIAALSAGWALNLIGWKPMLLVCAVPVLIMSLTMLWEKSMISKKKR